MSRAVIIVTDQAARARALKWVSIAPAGTRVEFKAPKRTLPQNDRMWAMLTDIAAQRAWHGIKITPDDWKLVFLDGLKREMRAVPNLDGTGFVNIGTSSSDLSVAEMTDMIELMFAWAAGNGVMFSNEAQAA